MVMRLMRSEDVYGIPYLGRIPQDWGYYNFCDASGNKTLFDKTFDTGIEHEQLQYCSTMKDTR